MSLTYRMSPYATKLKQHNEEMTCINNVKFKFKEMLDKITLVNQPMSFMQPILDLNLRN